MRISVSLVDMSPSTVIALKLVGRACLERASQRRRLDRRVGDQIAKHRRHFRLDHAGALGASRDRDVAPPSLERSPKPSSDACRWS